MDAWLEQRYLGLLFETGQCCCRVFPHYPDANRWTTGAVVRNRFRYRYLGMTVDAGVKPLLRNTAWQN